MTVIVAGNTGLAGTAISKAFEESGEKVIGINKSVVDLLDQAATSKFIKNVSPEMVIDAAALVGGIGANNSYPVEFLNNNLRIQSNIMEACFDAKVPRFIFLGSSCIYPKESKTPIKEEYLMSGALEETHSAYAIAKIAGLELVNSYRKEYGLNWVSLMPTNLYGPKDNFNLDASHVLPAFIRRFIEAEQQGLKEVTLWGTGNPLREFLHVDDLASAVVLVSQKYNKAQHLNIGTGEDISIKELAQIVAQESGYSGRIIWDSDKPDGTFRKVLDVTRIKALGWSPKIGLRDGISSTISWYRQADLSGEVRK
jgi:GDP-L-fucose synthase